MRKLLVEQRISYKIFLAIFVYCLCQKEVMIMPETFGQRLSRLRKEKGLTQEDIAKKIIISPQAVSKWENDLSSPDILVLSSLADILGVSVDTLLGREEPSENEIHQEEPKEDKKEERDEEEYEDASEVVDDDEVKHKKGIHIVDEDGSGIHITSDGIFAREKNGEHTKKVKIHKHKHENKDENVFWISNGSLFGLALIAYLLMGFLWKDQSMGWKMGWICFLIAIVVGSIITCVRKKKFTSFNYPVLTVAAYCTLGFLGMYLGFNGWGTYWFLFLTIPAFYLIFHPIDRYIHRNDEKVHGFIEIDDDDDEDDDDDDEDDD